MDGGWNGGEEDLEEGEDDDLGEADHLVRFRTGIKERMKLKIKLSMVKPKKAIEMTEIWKEKGWMKRFRIRNLLR